MQIFKAVFLCVLLLPLAAHAQAVPFNFVKQWELLPTESLASLVGRGNIDVVGTGLSNSEGPTPTIVNVVYLQSRVKPFYVYRCVEYTRSWGMETIQTNCYVAVAPQPTR
jgi:hypothetical protein